MAKRKAKASRTSKRASPVRSARGIKEKTKILLAVAAGGRCEFAGCNEFLFEHPLTLRDGNFSEHAHIVAFSEDGPRGRDGARPIDINDVANLMLLCQRDHKLVDDNPDEFPRKVLEQYKAEHEDRIRLVTGLGPDMKTTVVQLKALIGGEAVEIPAPQIYQAVAPRYPTDKRGCVIDLTAISTDDDALMETAKGTISGQVQRLYAPGMDVDKTRHISLFALGPIPMLAFLGAQLSNKITVDLFQRHRDNDEPSPWQWRKDGPSASYAVNVLKTGSSPTGAALILSLSGKIHETELAALPALKDVPVYELSLASDDPNVHFLRQRTDLEAFRKVYRNLLSRIMSERSGVRELHIFPAVPAPVGVALGHDLLPKVHPALLVYDRDKKKGGFVLRIKVNDHDQR
jgi:hypothetical protein